MKIDINCDMGESYGAYRIGEDEKIIRYITSANIACGFHAGDPMVMARTVELAGAHGVAVGAHPGYPDLMGYGRRNLETFPGEIKNYVLYQIGAMSAFARAAGLEMRHVKPHGALYNHAAKDERAASEIIEAVKSFDPGLVLFALAGSLCAKMATAAGLEVAREAFPDRAYTRDGRLAPRKLEGAVIHDPQKVRERVLKLVKTGKLASIEGEEITLDADTLCVHGDTPGAWELAREIRQTLESAGVTVAPVGRG
ncbi:MAG: 5-oxoprolinase subunit PxpA [Syntrophobacteraceae bacterium]